MLLSKAIETRICRSCAQGLFKTHSVECQGRARCASLTVVSDIAPTRLVMASADVCGDAQDERRKESISKMIVETVLKQIGEGNAIGWNDLETLMVEEPYVGVSLSVIVVEAVENEAKKEENGIKQFKITIQQLGGAVDIWCMRNNLDVSSVFSSTSSPSSTSSAASSALKSRTLERWTSRHDNFASIPHCVEKRSRGEGGKGGGGGRSEFAYLPLDACLGARSFGARVSHQPRTKRFLAQSGDLLFIQCNGFEDLPSEPVAHWLPWRLMRSFSENEQHDSDWINVLDSEIFETMRFAQNRFLSVLKLCTESENQKSFYGKGATSNLVFSAIRAGKYVPGGDAEFEQAFAHHCERLGADKLRMIALYNEQCGAMAGTNVDESYLQYCAPKRGEQGSGEDDDDEGEERGEGEESGEEEEEEDDSSYEWYYGAK